MSTNTITSASEIALLDGTLRLQGFSGANRITLVAKPRYGILLDNETIARAIRKAFDTDCVQTEEFGDTSLYPTNFIFGVKFSARDLADYRQTRIQNPRKLLRAIRHKLVAVLKQAETDKEKAWKKLQNDRDMELHEASRDWRYSS